MLVFHTVLCIALMLLLLLLLLLLLMGVWMSDCYLLDDQSKIKLESKEDMKRIELNLNYCANSEVSGLEIYGANKPLGISEGC